VNELQRSYSQEIEEILSKYPPERRRSAVIPLLYLVQRKHGSIQIRHMQQVAEILDVSLTEVDSVAGFYTLFHQEEGGRYRIQVCNDLPCALRGADEFLQELCERLGISAGETTPDGLFTVEAVKCLAACQRAPVFQLQSESGIDYYENQSIETAMHIIEELRRQSGMAAQAGGAEE